MTELKKTNNTVLIASSSLDKPTWGPVAEELDKRGYDVIAYEADRVASGTVPLAVHVGECGMKISYDHRLIDFRDIKAAWRRRPAMFAPDQLDWATQLRLDEERNNVQASLWSAVPQKAWFNSQENMRRAEDKLAQLVVAHSVGFKTPQTLITNSWKAIENSLPKDIILKMNFGVLYTAHDIRTLYTTKFANEPDGLPTGNNPFPGYWQPYLEKAREWRITAVGNQTFDAAIYTDPDAKDDWRNPEHDDGVTYKKERFPAEYQEKCLRFLGRFGLRFGAFDFVEDREGNVTFLECNTNGQYAWLEDQLGLPISAAIASELDTIAKANS